MTTLSSNDHAKAPKERARADDVDRHVGSRIRERRVMLGLTQQEMADLIGVTYQQAHKYERGINRLAAGRLWLIADVLGVEVGFFFEGLDGAMPVAADPRQRLLLDLARNFTSIPNRRFQEALAVMARLLAENESMIPEALLPAPAGGALAEEEADDPA